jgi:hypothetical protein
VSAEPTWFVAFSHHYRSNRTQGSRSQRYSTKKTFCVLSHFKSQILTAPSGAKYSEKELEV